MISEPVRTIGYFCPSCRQAVIVERSAFQLAASNSSIDCPCGKSSLKTEIMGDKVRLYAPCLVCEGSHVLNCSTHALLQEKIIAFSCGTSGVDCCYVGAKEKVYAAMQRLEETVDGLESEAGSEGMFLNDIVMEEILAELRDIGARQGISCSCGSRQYGVKVTFSSVELVCAQCGGTLKIPAATQSDMDDLCCKPVLKIHGKG